MPISPSVPPPDPWTVALAYLPLVKRLARDFHRCPFDTDDLVQEGLLAVHRAVAEDDPARDSFGGLARRAARNRMIDWLRWRQRAVPPGGKLDDVLDRADRVDLIDLSDVLAALSLRTEWQQTVVREHFGLHGPARTEAAIAVAFRTTRDGVARAQFRALTQVRKRLGVAS
jgi:RNA polymerase sigma factor (sigma-70 family)